MQSRSEGQNTQSLEATARQLCKSRGGRWSGSKGMARCPAHDDRTPSLGVTLGRRAILFHCFAGCDQASVIDAFRREGLSPVQLFGGPALFEMEQGAAPTLLNQSAAYIFIAMGLVFVLLLGEIDLPDLAPAPPSHRSAIPTCPAIPITKKQRSICPKVPAP